MSVPEPGVPLFVGVMSGTSLDGIDVVLATLPQKGPEVVCARTYQFSKELRSDLHELCSARAVYLEHFASVDVALGDEIGMRVLDLLHEAGVRPERVSAIGSHGQTVRHLPRRETNPFTLQIGDPNRVAEHTGIMVVADFRRRDVAAGGEGAPLVPAFHQAVFAGPVPRAIVNIGGMANVTLLAARAARGDSYVGDLYVGGFDTGPGNVLIDAWAERHLGTPMDKDGQWADQGLVDPRLLDAMLADPWFALPPPKSTGREYFDGHWLALRLEQMDRQITPAAVAATLTELTARTISDAITKLAAFPAMEVLVCGGGRHNASLMRRIAAAMPGKTVATTESAGVDGDWLEGLAFAWLAQQRLGGRAGNVPEVTGASGRRVLGAIYAAGPAPDQKRK